MFEFVPKHFHVIYDIQNYTLEQKDEFPTQLLRNETNKQIIVDITQIRTELPNLTLENFIL